MQCLGVPEMPEKLGQTWVDIKATWGRLVLPRSSAGNEEPAQVNIFSQPKWLQHRASVPLEYLSYSEDCTCHCNTE